jgi:hypothetical protein
MTYAPDVASTALGANEYNQGLNVETDVRGIRSVSGDQVILERIPDPYEAIFITGGFRRGGEWWFVVACVYSSLTSIGASKWFATNGQAQAMAFSGTTTWIDITPLGYVSSLNYQENQNITETWNGTVLLVNDSQNPPFFWLDEDPTVNAQAKMQAYSNTVPLEIADIQPVTDTTRKITFVNAQYSVPFNIGDRVVLNNVQPSNYNSATAVVGQFTTYEVTDCTSTDVTIISSVTNTYQSGGTVAPQYSWNFNSDWDSVHAGWMRMYQTPNVGTILVAGNLTATVYNNSVISTTGTVGSITAGGLSLDTALLTVAGTASATAGTYLAVTGTSSGSGTGAVFNIQKVGTATTYGANTAIAIERGGSGYAFGDTITIPGARLGGTTPANNLTITLYPEVISAESPVGVSVTAAATYTNVAPNSTSGAGTGLKATVIKRGDGTAYGSTGLITAATNYYGIVGTSITGAATYTNRASTTTGAGVGASFTIVKSGASTQYNNNISITVVDAGVGYQVGDTITIAGALLGGATPANNLSFVLSGSVEAATTVTVTDQGTGYQVGDIVTLPGASLGGATATNNLSFTVTAQLASPWTATITGVTSTAGLVTGNQIIATDGTGSLGHGGIYTVTNVVANTSITFTAEYGTTPLAGTVTDITKLRTSTTTEIFPVTVQWSQSFGLNQVPITWTPTATNLANQLEVPLRGASLDAFPANGQLFLCSYWDTVVFSPLNYATTSAPIIGVKLINQGRGLLSTNCWANTDKMVYGIDARDVWAFDGNNFVGIGNQRVKNWFFDQIDPAFYDRIHVENNSSKYQIEIYYPDRNAAFGRPNKMLSYRYDLDAWNPPREVNAANFACESPVYTLTREYFFVNGITQTGSGTGAQFDVVVTSNANTSLAGTYALSISQPNRGINYAVGDTIKLLGTSLGGTTPTNDVTVTVTGQVSGKITTFTWTGSAKSFYAPNLASRCISYMPAFTQSYITQKDQGFAFTNNQPITSYFRRDNIKLLKDYSGKLLVHRLLPEVVNLDAQGVPLYPSTGSIDITVEGANSVGQSADSRTAITVPIATDYPWAQINQNAYRVNTIQVGNSSNSTIWMLNATTWQTTQTEDDR